MDKIGDVGTRILLYLARHPKGADTIEGIISWWMAQRGKTASQVGSALGRMLNLQAVAALNGPNDRVYYIVNRKMLRRLGVQDPQRGDGPGSRRTKRRAKAR